jgi:hypothetical protein
VAIKVVEHSPGDTMNLAEQKIEREALLATSLSHPNIIATFKICTMVAGSALGTKTSFADITARSITAQDRQRARGLVGAGAVGEPPDRAQQGRLHSNRRDFAGSAGGGGNGGGAWGRGRARASGSGGHPDQQGVNGDSDGKGSAQGKAAAQSTGTAGSADSFDPQNAVVVDLPGTDVTNAAEPNDTKGSDSAQNNGGFRPGPVSTPSLHGDLELTDGEREKEDDQIAIEERCASSWAPALQ